MSDTILNKKFECFDLEIENKIAKLTLNRPEKLNSMIRSFWDELPEIITAIDQNIAKLLARVKTIAAYSYRKYHGLPFIYPNQDLNYVENFLHMMFSDSQDNFHAEEVLVEALDLLLILHADHEQNCSTSTVRMAGSSMSNIYGAISSGIS